MLFSRDPASRLSPIVVGTVQTATDSLAIGWLAHFGLDDSPHLGGQDAKGEQLWETHGSRRLGLTRLRVATQTPDHPKAEQPRGSAVRQMSAAAMSGIELL